MTRKNISDFLRRYGFRLLFLAICLFLLLRKDLSFQIRLKSPVAPPSAPSELPTPAAGKEETERLSLTETAESRTQQFQLAPVWPAKKVEEAVPEEPLDGLPQDRFAAFLERFSHVAEAEEKKFGIPAEFILAHGLLMSRAGTSALSEKAHNFFGLPCTTDWEGPRLDVGGDCKRSYPNAWTSFRDFSFFITTGERAQLPVRAGSDTRRWIKEVHRAGFRKVNEYQSRMDRLIKDIHAYNG